MCASYLRICWQIIWSCASLKLLSQIEFVDAEPNIPDVFDTNEIVSGLLWLWIIKCSFCMLLKCNYQWQLNDKTSRFHACGTLLSFIDAFSVKRKPAVGWRAAVAHFWCPVANIAPLHRRCTCCLQHVKYAGNGLCDVALRWTSVANQRAACLHTSRCRAQDKSTWKSVTGDMHNKHSCSAEICGLQSILIIENHEWWAEVSVIHCVRIVSCLK